jgi:hypothetical protein
MEQLIFLTVLWKMWVNENFNIWINLIFEIDNMEYCFLLASLNMRNLWIFEKFSRFSWLNKAIFFLWNFLADKENNNISFSCWNEVDLLMIIKIKNFQIILNFINKLSNLQNSNKITYWSDIYWWKQHFIWGKSIWK